MAKGVNQQEAYFAALVHRLATYRFEQGLPKTATPGKLALQPLILHDLNLKPLYYLFLEKNPRGKITGSSWVTADPKIPTSIVSETWNELIWSPNQAKTKARNWAKRVQQPGEKIKVSFICYDYPKIGVLAQITGKGSLIRTEKMFDVVSGKEISLKAQKERLAKSQAPGGEIRSFSRAEPVREPAAAWYTKCIPESVGAMTPAMIEGRAADCTRSLNLAVNRKELPVPYFRQEQESWCVPACGQMILGSYGIKKEQADIAEAMSTDDMGTSLENEEQGYETIGGESCEVSDEPSWNFVKSKIDEGLPVRMRINHDSHAIVCIGYKREEAAEGGADLWLIVNDPYSGRSTTKWDNINLTNYLTVSKT